MLKLQNKALAGSTIFSFSILAVFCSATAVAHKGHVHGAAAPMTQTYQEIRQAKLNQIGAQYIARIKPIFQRTCFDCHSNQTVYPWYYKLPGAKQLIDSDVAESKEHLDLSSDYPFKGHGTPEEDLKAIAEEVKEGDMPPLLYKVFHPSQKLNEGQKAEVIKWANESRSLFEAK